MLPLYRNQAGDLLSSANQLTAIQLICSAIQLTGFYIMGTLVVKGLIERLIILDN